ncbi:hypothetical protein [Clostridium sp.]|uniref:hypothetical protein n=1 Tax=Clostridium sp. TaxID=1506 RepID=UPI002FC620AA
MTKSKKIKHLKNNKCRVIKIEKDALLEFVYETIIDRLEQYFDILDCTTVVSHHEFNSETGEYICLINHNKEKLPDDIDIHELLSKMERTTTTLFSPNRYKEMSFDEIRVLLKES